MKIAYITSSSYSGSTLLSFILNAHPAIGTISEFDEPRRRPTGSLVCSCGEQVSECAFFVELERTLREGGLSYSRDSMRMMLSLHRNRRLNRLLTGRIPFLDSSRMEDLRDRIVDALPRYRHAKEEVYERNLAFMEAILRLQNASVFLDANKDPYRMRFLSRRHDVRAIYLFKNGIAGVYSLIRRSKKEKTDAMKAEACRRWFIEQINISRSLKYLPPQNVLQIGYSEMCNDVSGTLEKIWLLLEIEPRPVEGFAEVPHHIIGNVMRLGKIDAIVERDDWKRKMSQSDIAIYRRVYEHYKGKLASVNPAIMQHVWH